MLHKPVSALTCVARHMELFNILLDKVIGVSIQVEDLNTKELISEHNDDQAQTSHRN